MFFFSFFLLLVADLFFFFCFFFFLLFLLLSSCFQLESRGYLVDADLKELLPALPVVYVRAVAVDPVWGASEVGYLRNSRDILECPVYTTTFRGPTFVFLATLRVEQGTTVEQWILRAVALVMQTD